MSIENEIEIWKDVVGYEGLYQVSSFGNVKALNYNRSGMEGLKNCSLNKKGYLQVGLSLNKVQKTHHIHVIVAMAFHGHIPDGMKIVIDHIDNNKLNNRADNLSPVTNRENVSKGRNGCSSQYTGVYFNKNTNKWRARFSFNGIAINLGSFDLEIDAANAYKKAKKEWEDGLDLNLLYPKGRHKTSQYKGVSWHKQTQKWEAKYKGKHIGLYITELEAHEAVQKYITNLPINQ